MWLNIMWYCEPCFASLCSRDYNLYPFACVMKAIPGIYSLPFILFLWHSDQRGEQLWFQTAPKSLGRNLSLAHFQLSWWCQLAPGSLWCCIIAGPPPPFFFPEGKGGLSPTSGTTIGIALAGTEDHLCFKSACLLRFLTCLSAGKHCLAYF